MQISYQFKAEDIKELVSGHYLGIHQRYGSLTFLRHSWLILPVIGAILGLLMDFPWIITIVTIAAYAAFSSIAMREYHKSVWSGYCAPENHTLFLSPTVLTLTESELAFSNERLKLHCSWAAITEFNESDSYLYFWLDGVTFIPLPKRAFASEAELAKFRERVAGYRKSPLLHPSDKPSAAQ